MLVLCPAPSQAVSGSDTITTIAGTAVPGYSGDGELATAAQVNQPRATDVGPDGSIYVADTYNNRIRKITREGRISTIVGTGEAGATGDGGPAVEATITWPHDVAIDDLTGMIYIADSNSNRIRRVDTNGIITTFAGTGRPGYSGDGDVARLARLKYPKGLAVHGGALYVADSKNNRIRRIDLESRIITTIAGTGTASYTGDGGPAVSATFNAPQRIALSTNGHLFVADTLNHAIRRIRPNGVVTTVVGTGVAGSTGDGGPGVLARVSTPRGIAVDGSQTVYFSDSGGDLVRSLNVRTGIVSVVAGTGSGGYTGDGGPAQGARLNNPRGLTVDNQRGLIIADTFNNTIRRILP